MALRNLGGWFAAPTLNGWVLFATALVAWADATSLAAILAQARTASYAQTQGTILDSRVEVDRDEVTRYSVSVHYVYEVDGHRYHSARLRYRELEARWHWAKAKVAELPVGAVTTVYYDPASPSEAALMVGLVLADLLAGVLLLPFNLYLAAVWAAIAQNRTSPEGLPPGVQVIDRADGQRIRFPGLSRPNFVALTSGLAAFAVLMTLQHHFEPLGPIWLGVLAWLLVLAAGGLGLLWVRRKYDSGAFDLVFDDLHPSLTLPHSPSIPATVVNRDDVCQVSVFRETTQDSELQDVHEWHVRIHTRDDRAFDICSWKQQASAQGVATWIAQRLGM